MNSITLASLLFILPAGAHASLIRTKRPVAMPGTIVIRWIIDVVCFLFCSTIDWCTTWWVTRGMYIPSPVTLPSYSHVTPSGQRQKIFRCWTVLWTSIGLAAFLMLSRNLNIYVKRCIFSEKWTTASSQQFLFWCILLLIILSTSVMKKTIVPVCLMEAMASELAIYISKEIRGSTWDNVNKLRVSCTVSWSVFAARHNEV